MDPRVFISHSRSDREAALSLAERLTQDGFDVRLDRAVFDEWSTSGVSKELTFNRLLEDELASCEAFVFFVDRNPSPWQERELSAAMRRQWESAEMRIVPVVGPGEQVSGALERFKAVQMGADPTDPEWQREIVQALGAQGTQPVETSPSLWSADDRSKYRRRLDKIGEIAKHDEEEQTATESDPWQSYK